MSGGDFFDTNLFVYQVDDAAPVKQARAQRLIADALATDSACVSFQVIQETLYVLTRKFARRVPPDVAVDIMRQSLLPLWRVHPSAALYTRALDLQARLGISFYDSLIVAAALEAGCTRLLTEDLQDGQQTEGLAIENPFKE